MIPNPPGKIQKHNLWPETSSLKGASGGRTSITYVGELPHWPVGHALAVSCSKWPQFVVFSCCIMPLSDLSE